MLPYHQLFELVVLLTELIMLIINSVYMSGTLFGWFQQITIHVTNSNIPFAFVVKFVEYVIYEAKNPDRFTRGTVKGRHNDGLDILNF